MRMHGRWRTAVAGLLLAATTACGGGDAEADRDRTAEAPPGSAASVAGETQWDGPRRDEAPPASEVYGSRTMDPVDRRAPPAETPAETPATDGSR